MQDNRLVQEFQAGGFHSDIGFVSDPVPNGSFVSLSGLYTGIMPYRQAGAGGLSDALAPVSGLATPGEPVSVNKHPINRVVLFENEVHNLAQGLWSRQDATTGDWVFVANFDDAYSSYQNIGLYPVFNQQTNKRYLVTAYVATVNADVWRGVSYNREDNVVVSGIPLFLGLGGDSSIDLSPSECQVGNNIYFAGANEDSFAMVLNGLNLTISAIMGVGSVSRPLDYCAYSGIVYMAHKDISVAGVGGSGVITISKMDGVPSPVLRLPFEDLPASYPSNPELGYAVNTSASIARQKCLLFVDNNPISSSGKLNGLGQEDSPSMWLYYQNVPQKTPIGGGAAGVNGYSVWQIQGDGLGGLSVVQQIDTMMGPYRAGLGAAVIPIGLNDQAVISYCDNYPGWFATTPEKSFLTLRAFGGEAGQSFSQFDFDPFGPAPTIGPPSIGGPTKVSFSQDKLGGGSRWSPAAISTTTGKDVNIWDIVYTSGHFVDNNDSWRIHYKLMPSTAYHAGYSGIAGQGMSVRWYNDKFHAPNKRCILTVGQSHVSSGTNTNNQVNGLAIYSGLDYWVDWNYKANNLAPSDSVYLCGLLFDPNNSDIPPLGL